MIDESEKIERIQQHVSSSVRRFHRLNLSMLEAEVMDRLMDGRRTAAELVEEIYELPKNNQGFEAAYRRIHRTLHALEGRGLVSTNLLGREKPYRLTPHGIAVLSSILPGMGEVRKVRSTEVGAYVVTAIWGAFTLVYSQGLILQVDVDVLFALVATLFTMIGFSLALLIFMVRRFF
jgi:hypothetical protein